MSVSPAPVPHGPLHRTRGVLASLAMTVLIWSIYVFLVAPSVIVVPLSFGNPNELVFPPQQWGLELYARMLDPANGWLAAGLRSLQIGVLTTVCALVLGLSAAYGLARAEFPGKRALSFLLMSPIFAPTIVLALALYLYFANIGLSGSMAGLVIAHTLLTTPFVILTTGSALRQIDETIEIAATVMGATRMQVFTKVTLPLLRPAILSGGLFAFLLSFDEVVVAWFIGSSYDPTLPVKMYSSIQWEVSPVLAAISTVLFVLTAVVCVVAAINQPPD
ncbi:ABC transporter permease [Azospirillum doebereinerae]